MFRNSRRGIVLRISSDGDDRRIFLALKSAILGFFGVGKFGKYCIGWLDLSRDFWGYSKQSQDLWWLIFGPGFFLGFDFCPY